MSSNIGTVGAEGNFLTTEHRYNLMFYVACEDVPVYKMLLNENLIEFIIIICIFMKCAANKMYIRVIYL
jgi:hypothetical protein